MSFSTSLARLIVLVVCCLHAWPLLGHDKPNILIILADDLGFSDLGCYGGEIETPHLDSLAAGGLRFDNYYNTARCWCTRAAMMTGYYAQQVRFDVIPGDPPIKRGKRPAWSEFLPSMLKPHGYRTYHSGKWHLDGLPLQRGFDRSYSLNDHGRFFSPLNHLKDDIKLAPVKRGTGYYATTAIADHTIECLKEHADKFDKQPFFCFLAFTAPHFPLHALADDIQKYRDRYRVGWEEIRAQRWNRIKQLGLVGGSLSAVERDVGPPYAFPKAIKQLGPGEVNRPVPWQQLTAEQKEFQASKMAIHAAMIDRMDVEIGRVLQQLRAMQRLDDTLIMFLSDNGASAEIMIRDDGHDPDAPPGSADTHLCLGPGWSTTANTPFRRHKTWVHEGGIRTPLIVHWGREITDTGKIRNAHGHVIDIAPTILDLLGQTMPRNGAQTPESPGVSLKSAFASNDPIKRDSIWWFHEGNRAIRVDDWKLVAAKNDRWQLYNLSSDPTEQIDLSKSNTQQAAELAIRWQSLAAQSREQVQRDAVDKDN